MTLARRRDGPRPQRERRLQEESAGPVRVKPMRLELPQPGRRRMPTAARLDLASVI